MAIGSRCGWLILTGVLLVLLQGGRALGAVGDRVELHHVDGRVLEGVVISETTDEIEIEYRFGSVVTPMKFHRRQIKKVEVKETGGDTQSVAPSKAHDRKLLPAINGKPNDAGGYAVIPVRGVFGEELTAGFFERAIRQAKRSGAEAVVFHIDSPGGMVYELNRIREELDKHENDLGIAFYVDKQAFSAAALLCMSSEHFFVGPGARFGAAVAFRWEAGNAKVDAKFQAAFAAEWRALAQKVGREAAIVDAMIQMEKELWEDTKTGMVYPECPPEAKDDPDRYQQLDDEDSVLALDYEQALSIEGAVDGEADEAREVVEKMGLGAPDVEAFDGTRFSERYFKTYRTNMELARRAVRDFGEAGAEPVGNRAELKNKAREMMSNANKVIRLMDQYDYIEHYIHSRGRTKPEFEAWVRAIRRFLGRG